MKTKQPVQSDRLLVGDEKPGQFGAQPNEPARNAWGRDPNTGRFLKGGAGGPGRPPGVPNPHYARR